MVTFASTPTAAVLRDVKVDRPDHLGGLRVVQQKAPAYARHIAWNGLLPARHGR
jgi:hypothetical protein